MNKPQQESEVLQKFITIIKNPINNTEEAILAYINQYSAILTAVDSKKRTALHHAVSLKKNIAVDGLLSLGADANVKDENGSTPLHYAANTPNDGVVKMLNEAKADLNSKDKAGNTPLHVAVKEMHDDVASSLIQGGAKCDIQNAMGDTPLHLYAKGGSQRGVQLLTNFEREFGAGIYVQNRKGESPLHCAISEDNMYFFTFFIHGLNRRYYAQVDLKHPSILHGPHGDNLVHTAIRRLSQNTPDNEERTYTMLYFIAGIEPDLFTQKNAEGMISGKLPSELLKIESQKILELFRNPYLLCTKTHGDKQLLGVLQVTLNGIRDENIALRNELQGLRKENADLRNDVKELKGLMQGLLQALSNKKSEQMEEKQNSGSPSFFNATQS